LKKYKNYNMSVDPIITFDYKTALDFLIDGKHVTRKAFEDEYRFVLKKGVATKDTLENFKDLDHRTYEVSPALPASELREVSEIGEYLENAPEYPKILTKTPKGMTLFGWVLSDYDTMATDWILTNPFNSQEEK